MRIPATCAAMKAFSLPDLSRLKSCRGSTGGSGSKIDQERVNRRPSVVDVFDVKVSQLDLYFRHVGGCLQRRSCDEEAMVLSMRRRQGPWWRRLCRCLP